MAARFSTALGIFVFQHELTRFQAQENYDQYELSVIRSSRRFLRSTRQSEQWLSPTKTRNIGNQSRQSPFLALAIDLRRSIFILLTLGLLAQRASRPGTTPTGIRRIRREDN